MIPVKRKQTIQSSNKKKTKKIIVIDSDIEGENEEDSHGKENKLTQKLDDLEYRERDLALKERELALREREAKIRVMELSNLEKERQLKLAN